MILFLDFDDTLLNTKKFNEALAESALSKYGITKDIFLETHDAVKVTRSPESGYYNLDKHIELLAGNALRNPNGIKKSIFDFAEKKTKDFIFSDTPSFLKEHNKHTLILITLTHDANKYQEHKIMHSGITEYFNDVILTLGETKGDCIKRYISQHAPREEIVLLDDRGSWLKEATEKNPALISVQMRRKDGRYHNADIGNCAHVHDMHEFAQLLVSF